MPSQSTMPKRPASVGQLLATPSQWLSSYEEFITKNASQVSQIESALRSLTYIIPGRFRDAEIASESIHSGVQLLSLYHDNLMAKAAAARLPGSGLASTPTPTPAPAQARSAHGRYTRFWAEKSSLYRRVAIVLQMVVYTELLWEMSAKRRGSEKWRWRVVVALESIKAVCRLLLLKITRSRPIVTPVLPERELISVDHDGVENEEDDGGDDNELLWLEDDGDANGSNNNISNESMWEEEAQEARRRRRARTTTTTTPAHSCEWTMPRTGMKMPSLPESGDISSYLLKRVLTADDIRPASGLVSQLSGVAQAAEVLHLLAPLVYVVALLNSRNKRSWKPWLAGLAVEYAARQMRDGSNGGLGSSSNNLGSSTPLEREEWNRRGWAMLWWSMRGAFYENVTKGVVQGVSRRLPIFIGGIVEDYEYLWENYYFSTSA